MGITHSTHDSLDPAVYRQLCLRLHQMQEARLQEAQRPTGPTRTTASAARSTGSHHRSNASRPTSNASRPSSAALRPPPTASRGPSIASHVPPAAPAAPSRTASTAAAAPANTKSTNSRALLPPHSEGDSTVSPVQNADKNPGDTAVVPTVAACTSNETTSTARSRSTPSAASGSLPRIADPTRGLRPGDVYYDYPDSNGHRPRRVYDPYQEYYPYDPPARALRKDRKKSGLRPSRD